MKTVMIMIVNSDVDDEPEHDCPLVLLNHLFYHHVYVYLGYIMKFYPRIGDKGGWQEMTVMMLKHTLIVILHLDDKEQGEGKGDANEKYWEHNLSKDMSKIL